MQSRHYGINRLPDEANPLVIKPKSSVKRFFGEFVDGAQWTEVDDVNEPFLLFEP